MTERPTRAASYPAQPPQSITLTTSERASRTSTQPPQQTQASSSPPPPQGSSNDYLSDRATTAFIRRTLCSHNALAGDTKGRSTPRLLDELLPPLTSSNDVDLQLYAIIAVIIKEFVSTWYSKITPDHVFIEEVIQIIAHCTRALEQRLRKVDLEALLFDEIPNLFEAHLNAYRISKRTVYHNHLAPDARQIYHMMRPHPALSPVPLETDPASSLEQRQNEAMWRQLLVQSILAVLLPTEDLENGCLRELVAEIFSEMILGSGIGDKACQSWMLWELVTKVAELLDPHKKAQGPESEHVDRDIAEVNRLDRYGLLSPPPDDEAAQPVQPIRYANRAIVTLVALFWTAVHCGFLAFVAVRAAVVALAGSSSLRPRCGAGNVAYSPSKIESSVPSIHSVTESTAASDVQRAKRPIVSMGVWSCASALFELDARMPWLVGFASWAHWSTVSGPGRVGDTDKALDRLLSHHLQRLVFDPTRLAPGLRTLRSVLFPQNGPAPPRLPPADLVETLAIKRRCARALLDAAPGPIIVRLLGAVGGGTGSILSPERLCAMIEEQWLDVLEDSYLNKHLIFGILELVVVRLLPEVGERGTGELLDERLS